MLNSKLDMSALAIIISYKCSSMLESNQTLKLIAKINRVIRSKSTPKAALLAGTF